MHEITLLSFGRFRFDGKGLSGKGFYKTKLVLEVFDFAVMKIDKLNALQKYNIPNEILMLPYFFAKKRVGKKN